MVTQLNKSSRSTQVQEQATQETLQTLKQQTEDSLRTVHTENERLAKLHSRAESDIGRKDQEIIHLTGANKTNDTKSKTNERRIK